MPMTRKKALKGTSELRGVPYLSQFPDTVLENDKNNRPLRNSGHAYVLLIDSRIPRIGGSSPLLSIPTPFYTQRRLHAPAEGKTTAGPSLAGILMIKLYRAIPIPHASQHDSPHEEQHRDGENQLERTRDSRQEVGKRQQAVGNR